MKVLYSVVISLICALAVFAQSDPPQMPTIEEAYLAKDDGDGKAGEQVTEFRTTDVPIYCVVLLDSRAKVVVKMSFVAVAVSGLKPETKVVTASYTTNEGQNRVNFTGRPEGKWPAGRYRVDLFLDGKVAKNLEFEIRGAGAVGGNTSAAKYLSPTPPKPKPVRRPAKP